MTNVTDEVRREQLHAHRKQEAVADAIDMAVNSIDWLYRRKE